MFIPYLPMLVPQKNGKGMTNGMNVSFVLYLEMPEFSLIYIIIT